MNPESDLKKFHRTCVKWYQSKARALPWRELWRINRNPWHIWVSEIMLQQTVIKAVLPVYDRFLKQFPTPADLAKSESEAVRLSVRGLGYYRRFDFLHKATKHLIEVRNGQWPTSYDEWKAMPGIGDYTASAISSITLNAPHGVVDGNVERVMCRLFDIRKAPNLPELKTRFKKLMDQWSALGSPGEFNQSIMELGQTICTPTSPACPLCPVSEFCESRRNNSQNLAPGPKDRPQFQEIRLALIIPVKDENVFLMTRPKSAKFLRGTNGFFTAIYTEKDGWQGEGYALPKALVGLLNQKSPFVRKVIKHNITKHKIQAEVIEWNLDDRPDSAREIEFSSIFDRDQVDENLVSNLDRKAWHSFLKPVKPGRLPH